jgi:hypothetical protein
VLCAVLIVSCVLCAVCFDQEVKEEVSHEAGKVERSIQLLHKYCLMNWSQHMLSCTAYLSDLLH